MLIIGDFTARVGDPERALGPAAGARAGGDRRERPRPSPEQAFKVLDRGADRGPLQQRVAADAGRGALRAARRRRRSPASSSATTSRSGWRPGRRSRCSSCSTRCCRAMTRWRSKADVELGGTDQKFNLLFGARRPVGSGDAAAVGPDHADPARDRRGAADEQVAGNYVGVTEPPEEMFGKLMRIPDAAMPEYYRLLLEPVEGETGWEGCRPNEAKRLLARTIVARFMAPGGGRGGGGALRPPLRAPRAPRRRSRRSTSAGDGDVHLPALLADGLRPQPQRGAPADRAGRGQDRRRAAGRRGARRDPAGWTVRSSRSASGATSASGSARAGRPAPSPSGPDSR